MANTRRGAIKAQREGNVQENDEVVVAIDFSEVEKPKEQGPITQTDEKADDDNVQVVENDEDTQEIPEKTDAKKERRKNKKQDKVEDETIKQVVNQTTELEKHTQKQKIRRNKKIAIGALFTLSAGLLVTFNGSDVNAAAKTLASEYSLEYRYHIVGEDKAYDELLAQVEEQKAVMNTENSEYLKFIEKYKYKVDEKSITDAGEDIKALNTYYGSVIMANYQVTVDNYISALDEIYATEVELETEAQTTYDTLKAEYDALKITEVTTAAEAMELINNLAANEEAISNLTQVEVAAPTATVDGAIVSDMSNSPDGTCPMATWSMSNENTGATEDVTDIACSVELTYDNLVLWIETFFGLTFVEEVPTDTYIHTEKTFATGYLPSVEFMNAEIYTYLSEYLLPSDNAFSVTPLEDGYTVSVWDTDPNN